MTIAITGATGSLGRLVIDELLSRVDADRVAATALDLPSSHDMQKEKQPLGPRRSRRLGRVWAPGVAVSVAAHLAVLLAFTTAVPTPTIFSVEPSLPPVVVSLSPPPPLLPEARPDPPPGAEAPAAAPADPAPATLAPTRPIPRPPAAPRAPRPVPQDIAPLPVATATGHTRRTAATATSTGRAVALPLSTAFAACRAALRLTLWRGTNTRAQFGQLGRINLTIRAAQPLLEPFG